jgi:adenine phosphoribosyltransferase
MIVDGDRLLEMVRAVDDWPRPGVTFYDVTPVFTDRQAFRSVVDGIADHWAHGIVDAGGGGIDVVVGPEARGFAIAAPVALRLDAGFVPLRRPGRLPAAVESIEYTLEYGTDLLEIHNDAVQPGQRVLVVDDVLATGGTAAAVIRLVERLGGVVAGVACVLEIGGLGGRTAVGDHPVHSLVLIGAEG